MPEEKCKDCKFWMKKDGFCCLLEQIRKYCLKNNLLYWEERNDLKALGLVDLNKKPVKKEIWRCL